jgi:hypothetical protein
MNTATGLIKFIKLRVLKEEFKDTKAVISIRKSKKNRQCNGQKKNYKRTNNDLQNIIYKSKDRVTRTPVNTEVYSGIPEGWAVPAPLVAPAVLLL